MQEGRPIAFMSKALSPRTRSLSTYEREMMAVIHAVTKWRPYLIGRRFIVRTDQQSLPFFLEQRIHTPAQQRWVSKLLGYDYEMVYKKGAENRVADALSRHPESDELAALTTPVFPFISDLRTATCRDPDLVQIQRELAADPSSHPEMEDRDGLILDHGLIRVPTDSAMRQVLIQHFHDTPFAGHEEFFRTYKRLSQSCTWVGMKAAVRAYVQQCDVCQRAKADSLRPAGLLQPLPISDQVWKDVSMDFIEGLPLVRGYSVIMVVVDRLSKYAHFSALAHPFSARRVAEVYIRDIARLHSMPWTIVSDRDRIFVSAFWQAYFKQQGTKLAMSSAYHPQTDGQTEVVNRCIEQYLHCMIGDRPREWLSYLPWAEYSYNTAFHSAIGMTPFEAVYGRVPPTLRVYDPLSHADRTEADFELLDRDATLRRLKFHITTAQNRMKQLHDRKHRDPVYEVGDWVYVKVQPYRQLTLRPMANQKLSHRFYGPFQIMERIGPVAYRLDLPTTSRVHPVFHVSLLRARLGPKTSVGPIIHEPPEDEVVEPVRVLAKHRIRVEGRLETQILVEWLGRAADQATWEFETEILDRFPDFRP